MYRQIFNILLTPPAPAAQDADRYRLRVPGCPAYPLRSMRNKRIASFFGWSDTGKTSFIEGALKNLSTRGVRCAALKCTRHPGSFQLPGKDSTRFFQAGAESALMGGPETVLALRSPEAPDRAFLDRLFPDAAVVLVEGASIPGALRVLMAGSAASEGDLKLPLAETDLLVTGDSALAARAERIGVRPLAPEDIEQFLKILEERNES